jgi:hypothetical protein
MMKLYIIKNHENSERAAEKYIRQGTHPRGGPSPALAAESQSVFHLLCFTSTSGILGRKMFEKKLRILLYIASGSCLGVGFGVEALGCRVCSLGCMDQLGGGCGVWGVEYVVWCVMCGVCGVGCRVWWGLGCMPR